ncbi:MAG: nuclear transport factor 2 family protein [Acidimicrobiia bacterium]
MTGPSREELQHAVDRAAIVDLLTQYWMHVDRRDWEPVKAIFVPGTLVDYSALMPIGDAVPAEAVVDRIAEAIQIYAVTVHNMGNCEVTIDGDTAGAESVIVAHHVYADPERQGGRLPIAGLRYRDRLVRTPAGWRVEHRRATTDWRAWWDPRPPTYVDGRHQ